ncbi:MAG TPA: benzoate-CoA ligase family protein [Acidimicrobiia bacterium]|nr:benzoate-CoA ligase family protein [Acidimicrobiia bacterium]
MPSAAKNVADFFLFSRPRDLRAIITDRATWSYGQVADLSFSYMNRLRHAGLQPGHRVPMVLGDGPDYAAVLFAIVALGGVAVMINPELRTDHLATILEHAEAPLAMIRDRMIPTVKGAVPASTTIVEIAETLSPPDAQSAVPATAVSDRHPALWLFSGGTTGAPKIVVQTHGSFINTTKRYAHETLGYQADDVTIAVPRLFFGYATGSALFFPFSVGAATVLFDEPPTPPALLKRIRRHRPTILVTTPSAINALLQDEGASASDLASVRFATSAGEALPETLYHRWKERFGVELLDGLGTAEMWHIFITNTLGDVRPGTVGRPVPGFEVECRDEEGIRLEPNEVGLLWVRGDSEALGYFAQPELTAQVFRDGWVVTGDLISIDAEGYVTHRGRADDALKVKGKWLRPQEVESCLLEHTAVREAAVVGVPDEAGLVKPVAFVVRSAAVDESELKQHVLDRLEPYKHPRQIVFLDEFPVTHLGKVDRRALRRHLER